MTRLHFFAAIVVLLSLPGLAAAQQRAADGVALNDDGLPQYSTFSLCAIDPATGQSGASVTTRVPFVGRAVPHVRAGVGAVCTQASTVVEYGPRGLDLLAKGVEPQTALAQLLADDQQRESRQVGLIDMQGRSAAHTGKQNGNWAGSRQGKTYTVQANIMVGPEVVDAVAATFYRFASARPINDLRALAACIVGLQPDEDPLRLAKITTPILVVVGDQDLIARNAPELVELIPSARLVTIPGRDHMSAVPARDFKQAAIEFLG